MRKLLIAMLSSTLLCTSAAALAQDLSADMDILKGASRTVQKSDNQAEVVRALNDMRAAASDAKTHTPDKLQGQPADSPQLKAYRGLLDQLIAEIDASLKLASAGDLAGAKEKAKAFDATRTEGHKQFR